MPSAVKKRGERTRKAQKTIARTCKSDDRQPAEQAKHKCAWHRNKASQVPFSRELKRATDMTMSRSARRSQSTYLTAVKCGEVAVVDHENPDDAASCAGRLLVLGRLGRVLHESAKGGVARDHGSGAAIVLAQDLERLLDTAQTQLEVGLCLFVVRVCSRRSCC